MPRPKIRPISAEAAAVSMAAIESFSGTVFVPDGAATYETKRGPGRRWSARLEIVKANVTVGGSKDKPNENEAVYCLMTKAVPFRADPDKVVPVGTVYHIRVRVNGDLIDEGDELAARNQGVLVSLFAALGVDVKAGIPEDVLVSAFPEKGKEHESTLRGLRVFASLSLNPPTKEGGTGFLNVDRFLPDGE